MTIEIAQRGRGSRVVEEAVTDAQVCAIDVPALYGVHRLALIRMAVLLIDDVASAEDVVQGRIPGSVPQ